jgi:hypothetical protein
MNIPLGADKRGEAHLIGVILLIGLAIAGATLVFVVGSAAITDLRASTELQSAEYSMREVDSRLSQVLASRTDTQTLNFGGDDRNVTIDTDSSMTVVINENPSRCSIDVPMGTIVTTDSKGRQVGYEGGGVWRLENGRSAMVSPPDFQYQNGTIDFPVTSLEGSLEGSVDELYAERNIEDSAEARKEIRKTLRRSACRQPNNVTVVVESSYYEAWGDYFEQKTGVNPTYDHNAATVEVYLSKLGGKKDPVVDGNSVSADGNYVAEIDILGTAGSVTRDFGSGDVKLADPYQIRYIVNGTKFTPWLDGAPDDGDVQFDTVGADDRFRDNVNDPEATPKSVTVSLNGSAQLSVEAAIHNCRDDGTGNTYVEDNWADTGYVFENDDTGATWPIYRCTATPDDVEDDVQVEIDSRADKGSNNLEILKDGDKVPGNPANGPYQRSLREILDGRLDVSNHVQLQRNQVVFVYELSSYVSDGDDLNSYDFNDAVVLVTFRAPGSVPSETEFVIDISINHLTVSRK